jgi:hypothetical protein
MQQIAINQVVQASINEGKLFDSMKHLFASNTSIIGELMQNARRAHATKVEFDLDLGAETLTVSDDGQGIEDFAKLIALCESGWDEEVAAQDNPFGMGVFSYFFAAQTVTFKSKGQMLVLTHNDIKNKLPIQVTAGDVVNGTTVILSGLDKALVEKSAHDPTVKHTKLYQQTKKNALGFPIPVFFNGNVLDRSDAVDSGIPLIKTLVGLLSLSGLTHEIDTDIDKKLPRLFLQGLPVKNDGYYGYQGVGILHLDSQKFVARMPDRSSLFNEKEQVEVIEAEVKRVVREFLVSRKSALDPQDFVLKHWDNCRKWDCDDLLIDLDFVPASLLENLSSVRQTEFVHRHSDQNRLLGTLSRKDFFSDGIKAWIDAPDVDDGNRAVIARWFMLEKKIRHISSSSLPVNHWLLEMLPKADDIDFSWTVQAVHETKVPMFYAGDGSCELLKAGSVDITAAWDQSGEKQNLQHRATSGWVMVPTKAEEGLAGGNTWDDLNVKCYVIDRSDMDHTDPWDVFSQFTDEHDQFRDEWREEAQEEWEMLMAQLFQEGLHTMVQRTLRQNLCNLSEDYDNQFCLVIKPGEGADKGFVKSLDLGQDAFWASIEKLILEQKADGFKDAFQKAVQAAMAGEQT